MFLLIPLLALLIFFLAICLTILLHQSAEVKRRERILIEELWERRHRIPLLLEVVARGQGASQKKEVISLRAKVSSRAYTLQEQIGFEKSLSHLLADLFQKNEFESNLKSDAIFLELQKEFSEAVSGIRIALNDYNFEVQKWQKYCRMPWFLILTFLFDIRDTRPLSLV